MSDLILTAATIITMDDDTPRARAVAVSDGTIVAVGTVDDCRAALPGADVVDTGAAVLAPGFVEPHGHPLISGIATQAPARSIAPWDAPTWADVQKVFADAIATTDPDTPLWFAGYDALLHGHPAPKADELDRIFGERVTVITDNSGHGVYFNSALIKLHGWDTDPPADPVASHYGRNADGSLNGQGFELPVVTAVTMPLLAQMGDPLLSAAHYYALMSRGGYTSTSDMTYDPKFAAGYEALAAAPSCPLRVSMWEMSITDTYSEPTTFAAGELWLTKAGVKLWTDGSPWVGNIAISFPYLDTEATRTAGIDPATAGGAGSMNYTREQLDAILDHAAPKGWQMAFHANGDLALDLALDAYEDALNQYSLVGTDHRWRLEHCGAGTRAHFDRAARLGVHVSMAPFQYYYWGELLDGAMFDHGARRALGGVRRRRQLRGMRVPAQRRVGVAADTGRQHRDRGDPADPWRHRPRRRSGHLPGRGLAGTDHQRRPHAAPRAPRRVDHRGQARRLRRADRRPVDHRSGRIDRRGAGDGDLAGRSPGRPRRVPRCRRRCGQRRALPSGRPRRQGLLLKRRVSSLAPGPRHWRIRRYFDPSCNDPSMDAGVGRNTKRLRFGDGGGFVALVC